VSEDRRDATLSGIKSGVGSALPEAGTRRVSRKESRRGGWAAPTLSWVFTDAGEACTFKETSPLSALALHVCPFLIIARHTVKRRRILGYR